MAAAQITPNIYEGHNSGRPCGPLYYVQRSALYEKFCGQLHCAQTEPKETTILIV